MDMTDSNVELRSWLCSTSAVRRVVAGRAYTAKGACG